MYGHLSRSLRRLVAVALPLRKHRLLTQHRQHQPRWHLMEPSARPIIIVKKRAGHDGYHGGAWKWAYADFVTAMMALFIVLWLMNSSDKIKKAISAYFQDPSGRGKMAGSASAGTGETVSVGQDDMTDLKDKLEQALKKSPEFEKLKDYVQMSVTGEGLRVEMRESEKGVFFQSGS